MKHLLKGVSDLVRSETPEQISKWADMYGASEKEITDEGNMGHRVRALHFDWQDRRKTTNQNVLPMLRKGPLGGRCDSLGQIMVEVTGVSAADVEKSSLVVRPLREREDKITAPPPQQGGSEDKSTEDKLVITNNGLRNTITNGYGYLGMNFDNERKDSVSQLSEQLQNTHVADNTRSKASTALALPILVGEYKRGTNGMTEQAREAARETGTNQLRMYLIAAVKYLEAIGITGIPVYGVQTDGPIAVFSAAVIKGEYRVCTVTVYVLTES